MTFNADWEREAANWIRWARAPGHDAYWRYRDAFHALVPPPDGATLEVGCGEGRVARDLATCGHDITAVDASPTLLDAAAQAHPEGRYLLADAADLPFADDAFGLVVAYNSLMDVQDMPGAVREAARVLKPGGALCACVTHPVADVGRFASDEPDADFTIKGDYLAPRRFDERFERDGLEITFHGFMYPLEAYFRALEAAGLVVEALREPAAPDGDPRERRWQRLPLFLMWRARMRA